MAIINHRTCVSKGLFDDVKSENYRLKSLVSQLRAATEDVKRLTGIVKQADELAIAVSNHSCGYHDHLLNPLKAYATARGKW